jgi:hypothetical protein
MSTYENIETISTVENKAKGFMPYNVSAYFDKNNKFREGV